ncbi:hypothetical protein EJD97_004801, partial [Solanum chilense]
GNAPMEGLSKHYTTSHIEDVFLFQPTVFFLVYSMMYWRSTFLGFWWKIGKPSPQGPGALKGWNDFRELVISFSPTVESMELDILLRFSVLELRFFIFDYWWLMVMRLLQIFVMWFMS